MTMEKLAKLIRKRLRNDKDIVIAVTGDEGEGKSRFTIELAKMIDPRFDVKKNIAYRGRKEIEEKFNSLPKYSVLDIDEAIKDFFSRNAMTLDNKKLVQLFSIIREKNIVTFLLLPNFWNLDPYYRNHRIRIWIHLTKQGHVLVLKKSINQFTFDKWYQALNEKLVNKYLDRYGDAHENYTRVCKKTKGYVIDFNYTVGNEQLWNEYLEVKKEIGKTFIEEPNKARREHIHAKLIIGGLSLLLKTKGMNIRQQQDALLTFKVNCADGYLNRLIKALVEHKKDRDKVFYAKPQINGLESLPINSIEEISQIKQI